MLLTSRKERNIFPYAVAFDPLYNRVTLTSLEQDNAILQAIKANLPKLEELLRRARSHWEYEDFVYRFYHGSYKVYGVQKLTAEIVDALQAIDPEVSLNARFTRIIDEGTDQTFQPELNRRWDVATRPLVEAFFHARFFLEMAVKYGAELDEAPELLPSGWAAVLELYNAR